MPPANPTAKAPAAYDSRVQFLRNGLETIDPPDHEKCPICRWWFNEAASTPLPGTISPPGPDAEAALAVDGAMNEADNAVVKLKLCGHVFHKSCLMPSLEKLRTTLCPYCRRALYDCQAFEVRVKEMRQKITSLQVRTSQIPPGLKALVERQEKLTQLAEESHQRIEAIRKSDVTDGAKVEQVIQSLRQTLLGASIDRYGKCEKPASTWDDLAAWMDDYVQQEEKRVEERWEGYLKELRRVKTHLEEHCHDISKFLVELRDYVLDVADDTKNEQAHADEVAAQEKEFRDMFDNDPQAEIQREDINAQAKALGRVFRNMLTTLNSILLL